MCAKGRMKIAVKERDLSNERWQVSSLTDECTTLKGKLEKTEKRECLHAGMH